MSTPQPVDRQRLQTFLNSLAGSELGGLALNFTEHKDELVYPTDSGIIFINQHNENILQIRGQWRGIAEDDDAFGNLFSLVQDCNLHRSGPKAYTLPIDNHQRYSVGAEVNLIVSQGATECQLAAFYETALSMILGLFQDLNSTAPELVTWKGETR